MNEIIKPAAATTRPRGRAQSGDDVGGMVARTQARLSGTIKRERNKNILPGKIFRPGDVEKAGYLIARTYRKYPWGEPSRKRT